MKINNIFSWGVIVAMFAIVACRIVSDASDIILHWNYLGRVTDYGSRYLVLGIPFLSLCLYFVVAYYIKRPNKVNMSGVPIVEFNKRYVVSYLFNLRLVSLLLLLYLTICSCGYLPFHVLFVVLAIAVVLLLFLNTKKKCKRVGADDGK